MTTFTRDIIVVDDIEANLHLLTNLLTNAGYKVRPSNSAAIAIKSAIKKPPGLILLDVNMPVINGFEACERLKRNPHTSNIPIIFVTAMTDSDSVIRGFKVGGSDYISKPFRAEEVLSRVETHLRLREYESRLENKIEEGLLQIRALNEELENTQNEVMIMMGTAAEGRSKEVGQHVKRVAQIASLLASFSGLCDHEVDIIRESAPLHDFGKIAIPDAILNKPGKLTSEEWTIMKSHTQIGYDMLNVSERPLLKTAAIIALEHHEKWDGSGYPNGLKGTNISLAGRVTAIADVFDALANKRCYKKAWAIEDVMSYMKENRGTHFDPDLIDILFENIEQFISIWENAPNPVSNN